MDPPNFGPPGAAFIVVAAAAAGCCLNGERPYCCDMVEGVFARCFCCCLSRASNSCVARWASCNCASNSAARPTSASLTSDIARSRTELGSRLRALPRREYVGSARERFEKAEWYARVSGSRASISRSSCVSTSVSATEISDRGLCTPMREAPPPWRAPISCRVGAAALAPIIGSVASLSSPFLRRASCVAPLAPKSKETSRLTDVNTPMPKSTTTSSPAPEAWAKPSRMSRTWTKHSSLLSPSECVIES
mmetsp:Transcript_4909/g.14877  ORF Transcript_4909/g.14877 Transcript_4909/m.14877 type:complete len:250 (+) Transcript_4909:807-1556(+)